MPMAGLRGPQPPLPSTSLPNNFSRRRRHSLPALSSEELNQLSANATKSRSQRDSSKATNKSYPDKSSSSSPKTSGEKITSGAKSAAKNLRPGGNIIVSKELEDEAFEEGNTNDDDDDDEYANYVTSATDENGQRSPPLLSNGTSTLQSKVQSSKGNAVFIFRFDDKDEKTDDNSKDSAPPPRSPGNTVENEKNFPPPELSQTWPFNSVEERNSFNLLKNSVRYNTLGFCGFKHKQFRENGKVHKTMTPVLELKTPIDETEFDSDDEWSINSTSDYWTDTRSSNGASSPRYRPGDATRRQIGPVKINANSNNRLTADHSTRKSKASLRSALSLSPRRSSSERISLSAMRDFTQRTRVAPTSAVNQSTQRRTVRRGSIDSEISQIFSSLKASASSAKSNATSNSLSLPSSSSVQKTSSPSPSKRLLSVEDTTSKSKSISPLPPRLLARRRSIGALPDVASFGDMDEARLKRQDSILSTRSDPIISSKNSTSKRTITKQSTTRRR